MALLTHGPAMVLAEANGEYAGSMKRFAEMLSARGFEKENTRQARGFRGLRIADTGINLFEKEETQ